MKLSLLRHAKSSWGDDSLEDFERPLNKRGQHDVPDMATRIKARGNLPDRILCSPALRTTQTAGMLLQQLGLDTSIRHFIAEIYEAAPSTLLDVIAGHGGDSEELMLIGHNPGIEYLAAMLNGGERLTIPTCTICEFEILSITSWQQIANAQSRLNWHDYPKNR